MASRVTDTNTTKLKPTLDDNLKRFSCGQDELCFWRMLCLCYYAFVTVTPPLPTTNSVLKSDFDINDCLRRYSSDCKLTSSTSEWLSKTVTRIVGDKANNITVTFCLQLKPLALYFASAETAFAGIPMNVKSLSTMLRHSWKKKNAEQPVASLLEAPVTFTRSFSE